MNIKLEKASINSLPMIVQSSYCTHLISPAVPLRPAVLLPAAKYSV